MAADKTAILVATQTLVASTGYKVNLTGRLGNHVELVHHGNVTDVIYYQVASREAGLGTLGLAANEHPPLLSGERLTIGAPRTGFWIRLISAGTPTVTVNGNF